MMTLARHRKVAPALAIMAADEIRLNPMSGWSSNRHMRRRCCLLSAALAIALAAVPTADARPGTPTIVLEAHVGQRAPEIAAAMAPVLDELERHGFAVRPAGIQRLLQGRAPRPGRLDDGKTIADIKQLVAAGRSAFDKGLLEKSEAALRGAVELIRRNPALLVLDTNNEKVTYSAFLSLAMTLAKRGNMAEANSTMLDLLRLSSMPIPQNDYSPKAQDLHSNAEKQAQAMGRGSLSISVSDSRAMIFVDYTYRGLGKVALGDQIPGAHYVLVQVPGTIGLQYVQEVQAREASALDVNWQIESMLHLDGLWAGLVFATEAERARESLFATTLAHSFGGDDVIILSAQNFGGVPFIGGIQYPANGDVPIGAFVPVNGGEALLRSLGTYLYNGTMAASLRLLRPPSSGEASSGAVSDSDTRRSTWIPGQVPSAVMVAGTVTIVGGAVAYAATPYDQYHPRSDGTDGRSQAVYVMLGGSLGLGGGAYLWSRASLSTSRITAGALAMGVASIAAGVELYLVHQDPSPTGPMYIRDTAKTGLIVGSSGLALTGVGIWLLYRERSSPALPAADVRHRTAQAAIAPCAPFASAGPARTILGCMGSF